jgi:hypothetical protein
MKKQFMEFLKSLLSRKFLLSLVAAFVAFGNAMWDWELSQEQVWAILVPLLGFIGVEGIADIKGRSG